MLFYSFQRKKLDNLGIYFCNFADNFFVELFEKYIFDENRENIMYLRRLQLKNQIITVKFVRSPMEQVNFDGMQIYLLPTVTQKVVSFDG